MSNKNEVFEYLIDQLRQQVNKKDVTSFNVSVQISDLDEVKQVIHNLQQHIAGRDDEIRVLKDTLRQQVNNNQCEDLAHEVLSLKNQLRDASAQIKELHLALVKATGDAEAYKLIRKQEQSGCRKEDGRGGHPPKGKSYVVGEHGPEQYVCRKEDAQECEHSWIIMPGLFLSEGNPNNVPGSELCCKCGKREFDVKGYKPKDDTQECSHNWRFVNGKAPAVCINCGMTKSSKCEHEWQFYGVGFPCMCIKCGLKK